MKRFFLPVLLAFAVVVGLCASCKKTTDTSGEPKMYAFGFLAEKNVGNLYRDYYVNVTDSIIRIEVPAKADITFLVPSFEMSDKDSAYVDSAFQKTGKSGHDFSEPVKYTVRDGTNYAYYTVIVTKAAPLKWSQKSALDLDVAEIETEVNSSTGYPSAAVAGKDGYLYYVTYDGSSVAAEKVVVDGNPVSGSDVSLCFSKSNIPYMSYVDSEGALNVLDRTSKWEYAGKKIRKGCRHAGTAIGFINDFKLMVFASDSVDVREISNWNNPIAIGGRDFAMKGDYPQIVWAGDEMRILLRNSNPDGISICGYTGTSWTNMAEAFNFPGVSGAQTVMQAGAFSACVGYEDDILMAVNSNVEGEGLRERILRYDSQTGSISQLGTSVKDGYAGNSVSGVAVSYQNDIYFLYTVCDASGNLYPYVAEYDGASADWKDALSMNSEPIKAADIVVNSDAKAYVFTATVDGKLVLVALE